MSNLNDSHGRLARWALILQPYNFIVKHQSVKANSNAAGLSRDPSEAEVGGMSEPLGLLPVTLSVTRHGTSKGVYQKVNNKKENKRESKEMNKKDD